MFLKKRNRLRTSVLTNLKVLPVESHHRLTLSLGHYYINEDNIGLGLYGRDLTVRCLRSRR